MLPLTFSIHTMILFLDIISTAYFCIHRSSDECCVSTLMISTPDKFYHMTKLMAYTVCLYKYQTTLVQQVLPLTPYKSTCP